MIWNDFCQLLLHQYSLGNIQNQSDTIPKPSGQTLSNHISAWDRNGTPQKTPELIWLSSKYSYWMLLTNWILRWLDYVWACLKGFWMVSDWSWMFTRLYLWKNSWKTNISLYSSNALSAFPSRGRKFLAMPFTAPILIDLGLSGRCRRMWVCVADVWEVSWVVLILSGVEWGYDVKFIYINPIRVLGWTLVGWFLLSQMPWNVWGLSRKVSKRCLGVVWVTLVTVCRVWCASNW